MNSMKSGTQLLQSEAPPSLADDIHPVFANTFQESLDVSKFDKFKPPPLAWDKCLKIVSSPQVHSLQELGDYWRFIWELAASCPITYISDEALPDHLLKEEQNKLESYEFKLIVDGRQLFKPIKLHGNAGGYTTRRRSRRRTKPYMETICVFMGILWFKKDRSFTRMSFEASLSESKTSRSAITTRRCLTHRINQGPRSRWLTGEIFVEKGLEDALQILIEIASIKFIQNFVHFKISFTRHWAKSFLKFIKTLMSGRSKENVKSKKNAKAAPRACHIPGSRASV